MDELGSIHSAVLSLWDKISSEPIDIVRKLIE